MTRRLTGTVFFVLALNLLSSAVHADSESFREEMLRLRQATIQGSKDADMAFSPQYKAHFATMTFDYGCLYMYFQPEKTPIWADTFFDKVSDDRREAWRAMVGTDSGTTWYAPFEQGPIAVVFDPEKGGCHIISWGAEAEPLHEEMRLMSARARDNLSHTKVNYFYRKGADEKGRNHSLITIMIPDEDTHVLIDAATYADNHEPATISITSNRNYAYTPVPRNYTPIPRKE